jgi:hypothetical protein
MHRRHLIIPAALLAASALLGGRALIGSLPLGPDSTPASSSQALTTPAMATDDQLAASTKALDDSAARIAALEADVPPALPPVTTTNVAAPMSGPSATSGTSASSGQGASSGRDHAEDDGGDDDAFEDRGDDDGAAHDLGDDHGGAVAGSDDGGGDHGDSGNDD